jgi:hypothetical protein
MKLYEGPPDDRCPYRGGKLCAKVCPTCHFQQQFAMTVNGQSVHRWECSLVVLAPAAIETAGKVLGVQAAIESFRNETVEQTRTLMHGSFTAAQALIETTKRQLPALQKGKSDE